MKTHPHATYFPAMPADEFNELVEDIRANGLIEPITLFEGKILDGVHRQRACELAGVEPRYQDWQDTNPLRWVISKNLHRRHLEKGQRVMVLIDAGLLPTSSDETQGGGSKLRRNSADVLTKDEAAEQAGVDRALVTQVKTVAEEEPELADEIRKGTMSANRAHMITQVKRAGREYGATRQAAVMVRALERGDLGHNAARDALAAAKVAFEAGDQERVKAILKTTAPEGRPTKETEAKRQRIKKRREEQPAAPTEALDWGRYPETAALIDKIGRWQKQTDVILEADEIGKLAPEAGRFLANRIRRLIGALDDVATTLEERHGTD